MRKYNIIKPLFAWLLCLQAVCAYANVQPAYSAKPIYSTSQGSVWSKYHGYGGGVSPIGATGISSYGGMSSTTSCVSTSLGTRSNTSLSFNYDRQYSVGATNAQSVSKRRENGEEQNPSDPYLINPVGEIPFLLMIFFAAVFAIHRRRKATV